MCYITNLTPKMHNVTLLLICPPKIPQHPYMKEKHMPPRGPLAHLARWQHEGQRQYKPDGMGWVAKSHPAPPSPGVITCRGDRALMTA